jgi:ribosomal protein S6--L-glutamate ligase
MIGGHPYLLEFNLLFGNEALNHLGIRLGPIIHDYLVKRWAPAPDLPWPDAG